MREISLRILAVCAALLLWCPGCSNGWPSTESVAAENCTAQYHRFEEAMGRSLIEGPGEWHSECVKAIAAAIEPCREYKYHSDSALQCMSRRGDDVLKDANTALGHREIEAYTAMKDRVRAMADKDQIAWCGGSARTPAEKEACGALAKEATATKIDDNPFGLKP